MSTTPLLIGLTGHKRAGKDTAAKILAELIGEDVAILHFADALKDEVAHAFQVNRAEFDDADLKDAVSPWMALDRLAETPASGVARFRFLAWVEAHYGECNRMRLSRSRRQILQWWGQWRRDQYTDYWLLRVVEHIANHKPRAAYLIADTRHANEAQMILGEIRVIGPHLRGAYPLAERSALIRIENPQADAAAKADTHESEAGLAFPFATHTIHNTGDLAHLRAECERVLAEIRGKG